MLHTKVRPSQSFLIPPRASKTIYALARSSGYNFYTSIHEFVDNSVDSFLYSLSDDKNIKILYDEYLKKGINKLVVADTGSGMDLDTLKEALTIGSKIDKDPSTNLGRFGIGLNTGAMSLGTRITVVTKKEDGDFFKAVLNIEEILKSDIWNLDVFSMEDSDHDLVKSIFPSFNHGTFVIIEDFSFEDKHSYQRSATLRKKIGKSFFKIINAGVKIEVDGKLCSPYDPLEWEQWGQTREEIKGMLRYQDEGKISVRYIDKNKNEKESYIIWKAICFPFTRFGEIDPFHEDRQKKYGCGTNSKTCGIYVYRANREVSSGETLSMFSKHTTQNSMRIAFYFPTELDDIMGVGYDKRISTETQSIEKSTYDKMMKVVKKTASAVTKLCNNRKKERKSKTTSEFHSKAQDIINKKASLIDGINIKKGVRGKGNIKGSVKSTGKGSIHKNFRKARTTKMVDTIWEEAKWTALGPLYDVGWNDKGKMIITWNQDHKLHRLISSNKNVTVIFDLMFHCMAVAETNMRLGVMNDEEMTVDEVLDSFKKAISDNMRILLDDFVDELFEEGE